MRVSSLASSARTTRRSFSLCVRASGASLSTSTIRRIPTGLFSPCVCAGQGLVSGSSQGGPVGEWIARSGDSTLPQVPLHRVGTEESLTSPRVTRHCRVSYAFGMTTKGTPGRVVRIDNETWAAYTEACQAMGTTRADDLRRHIHRQIAAYRRRQREAESTAAAA
jgi:hypothetical protein